MPWILAGAVLLLASFLLKGAAVKRTSAVLGGALVVIGLIRL